MVSRNNQRIKIERMLNQKQRFGIRKLSIGVVSVLLGTTFFLGNGVVHADIVSNSQITTTSSTPASSSDSNSSNVTITSSETGSAASSATTNDTSASSATSSTSATSASAASSSQRASASSAATSSSAPTSASQTSTSSKLSAAKMLVATTTSSNASASVVDSSGNTSSTLAANTYKNYSLSYTVTLNKGDKLTITLPYVFTNVAVSTPTGLTAANGVTTSEVVNEYANAYYELNGLTQALGEHTVNLTATVAGSYTFTLSFANAFSNTGLLGQASYAINLYRNDSQLTNATYTVNVAAADAGDTPTPTVAIDQNQTETLTTNQQ